MLVVSIIMTHLSSSFVAGSDDVCAPRGSKSRRMVRRACILYGHSSAR